MQSIWLVLAASLFTVIGGLLALKITDRRHLILAFGAGVVLGTSLFELLPEGMELINASHPTTAMTLMALGFGFYFVLNNWIAITSHKEDHECENDHHRHTTGMLNVGGLSIHSLMDGFILGLAFKASPAVGLVVALAVIAHDISDGINTVNLVLKSGGTIKEAKKWLAMDAIAPIFGFIASLFVTLSNTTLGMILAVFSGFFLYIGASDLVPECHHDHPKLFTSIFFGIGATLVWCLVNFAHH